MSVQDSHSSVFRKLFFLLCSFQNLHILVHFVGFDCILPGSNNLLLGRFKLCRCLLLHSSLRPWPSCPMAEVEQSAPYGVYTLNQRFWRPGADFSSRYRRLAAFCTMPKLRKKNQMEIRIPHTHRQSGVGRLCISTQR